MSDGLKIAVVLGLAAILTAFLIGGRYTIVASATGPVGGAYVVDRFTGSIRFCVPGNCMASKPPARVPAPTAGYVQPPNNKPSAFGDLPAPPPNNKTQFGDPVEPAPPAPSLPTGPNDRINVPDR